jgi:hypothetical protein
MKFRRDTLSIKKNPYSSTLRGARGNEAPVDEMLAKGGHYPLCVAVGDFGAQEVPRGNAKVQI